VARPPVIHRVARASSPPDVCGSVSTAWSGRIDMRRKPHILSVGLQLRADAPVATPDRASARRPGSIGRCGGRHPRGKSAASAHFGQMASSRNR